MHKFYHLTKIKIILSALNIIKYASWCGFFICQGKAIQQAIEKNILIEQLYQTLFLFFLTKLVVMLTDVMNQFVIDYNENDEIQADWRRDFPKKLFRDNEAKYNLIYLKYFDLLPNLFQLECKVINNRCTIACSLIIAISMDIYTGFYYGLLALMVVFLLNYVSKNLALSQFNDSHKAINENKLITVEWIAQYFNAYREIAFNWHQQINEWAESFYNNLHESRKRFIVLHLFRDVLAQLLVEIPFVLNTCIVIIGVYLNYLTITQMFVWVGLSQFVINASNAFLENKVNLNKKKILSDKLEEIKAQFQYKEIQSVHVAKSSNEIIEVKLLDNSVNQISLIPGIYSIKGTNGSGKSTLLNSILGFERLINVDNYCELGQMLSSVSQNNIRVIERDPVIFNDINQFNQQILGPELSKCLEWQPFLSIKIKYLFSKALSTELQQAFEQIESRFNQRRNKNFSSGEKILISLMRALASWDKEVTILVVDECTAFLDNKIKALFLKALSELSIRVSVYLSANEVLSLNNPAKINLRVINNHG